MSKVKQVVAQAELFEKLAIYGDRKSFLHALAQEATAPQPVKETELMTDLIAVYDAIQNWIHTSGERQAELPAHMKGLPVNLRSSAQMLASAINNKDFTVDNLNLLRRSAMNLASVANLGSMDETAKTTWLQSVLPPLGKLIQVLGNQIGYLEWWKQNYAPTEPTEQKITTLPETTVLPTTTVKGNLPRISMEAQRQLNQLLVPSGDILPIKETGILDSATKSALKVYRDKYSVPFGTDNMTALLQSLKSTLNENKTV